MWWGAVQSARTNFGRCKNTFFASCLSHADWNCRSAIVFHHAQHCILKVGKFSRACPCRVFLQSLLSCLVHPYLLRNLFQLLFYSFRQVRFWAWIGATKMDPLGGGPLSSEKVRWNLGPLPSWTLGFAVCNYCVSTVSENGLAWRCLFLDVATPFLASSGIENEIKTCCGTGAGRIKNGSVWRAHFWLCRI